MSRHDRRRPPRTRDGGHARHRDGNVPEDQSRDGGGSDRPRDGGRPTRARRPAGAPGGDVVFGLHAVRHLLVTHGEAAARHVRALRVQAGRQDQRIQELEALAASAGVPVTRVPRGELAALTRGRHQGVVATLSPRPTLDEGDLPDFLAGLAVPALLLVLDGVQDPHNLGACLRSANAAGANAVIVPKHRAVGLTPAVRKVACGAAEATPLIEVTNLARTLGSLRDAGIRLIGTDDEADRLLYEADLTGPCALVMGGEARGVRRLTREACDDLVRLPMVGVVESLNVSVAAGICVFEAVRQRAADRP